MDAMGRKNKARIVITPRRGALLAAQDNVLDVLVQVCAPDEMERQGQEPPPMGLALVIDRSGSMKGTPLEEAKRCCEFAVQRLRDQDSLALVLFDHRAEVLQALITLGERSRFLEQIGTIVSGGSTNLHGGWLAGAEQLAPKADSSRFQRVILLSDGNANEGVVETDEIVTQCRALADAGVTTSTYGLGHSFNEDLMVAMAEAGRGSHYYGATADDLFEPFTREFDLLSYLWRRDVMLKVVPASGVEVTMVNAHVPGIDANSWRLPDIAVGSEAWAILRLRIPRDRLSNPEGLLRVVVSGRDAEGVLGDSVAAMEPLPVLLPTAFGAVAESAEVSRRAVETDAAEMLLKCRHAARADEWEAVDSLLTEAKQRFAGHEWVSSVIASMTRLAEQRELSSLSKDALYSSRTMSRRLRSTLETDSLNAELDLPSFLRRSTSSGTGEYVRRLRDHLRSKS